MTRREEPIRKRAVWVALVVAGLLLTVFSLPVAAGHVHVIGEWSHGMVDAEDSDYYLHPFNHSQHGHSHESSVQIGLGSTVYQGAYCQCVHLHIDYYTWTNECFYWSGHSAYGMTYHKMYHHNPCA